METIGRTRRDHLVEANGINKIARDLKVCATRSERCWSGERTGDRHVPVISAKDVLLHCSALASPDRFARW